MYLLSTLCGIASALLLASSAQANPLEAKSTQKRTEVDGDSWQSNDFQPLFAPDANPVTTRDPDLDLMPMPGDNIWAPLTSAEPQIWMRSKNASSVVSSDWDAYVKRLHLSAMKIVNRTTNSIEKDMITGITNYHYATLLFCIHKQLDLRGNPTLSGSNYLEFTATVEKECYVPWRYSVWSGLPPFQLIAHNQKSLTAKEIEDFMEYNVKIAQQDLELGRVPLIGPQEKAAMQKLMPCIQTTLQTAVGIPIDKEKFYQGEMQIATCAMSTETR